ncbi:MAG: chemotaxis protein CheB [Bacteroidetes bacterium]|nr:MAG: chemotaxis protein CheB [Bacteroidota bacterium]
MAVQRIKYIVIGGSAGSFRGVTKILSKIPKDYPLPVILCLHRLKHVRSGFVEALELKSNLPIVEPSDKMNIQKGKIYLAPANYHLIVELGNTFALSTFDNVNHSRPAIDLTFESSARVFRNKMAGIMLSGANKDGAKGMRSVHINGGITIIQNPSECQARTMPEAANKITKIDHVYSVDQIINYILKIPYNEA